MNLGFKTTTALVALAFATTATAQELKFSTFVPPTHGFVTDVLQPLGKEIEKNPAAR